MGMPATAVGLALRALAHRDEAEFVEWRAVVNEDDEEKSRFGAILFDVFRALCWRRFADESDLRSVAQFLQAERELLVDGKVPFLEAEALIRSALGERGLVDGIGRAGAANTRLKLVVYLIEELGLDVDEIDGLIVDGEQAVTG